MQDGRVLSTYMSTLSKCNDASFPIIIIQSPSPIGIDVLYVQILAVKNMPIKGLLRRVDDKDLTVLEISMRCSILTPAQR